MSQHDKKINDLIAVIDAKRKTIGTKPRAAWKTNGILKYEGTHININVAHLINCVDAVAHLLREQAYRKEACALLAVPYEENDLNDYLEDFKLRASILKWDEEKKKLDVLEKKLKDLRSEDAKTADALSDILAALS